MVLCRGLEKGMFSPFRFSQEGGDVTIGGDMVEKLDMWMMSLGIG